MPVGRSVHCQVSELQTVLFSFKNSRCTAIGKRMAKRAAFAVQVVYQLPSKEHLAKWDASLAVFLLANRYQTLSLSAMIRYLPFSLIIASILLGGCKTKDPAVLSAVSYEGDKLVFGNGGGFTGQYDTYTLLDNGQLFRSENASGTGGSQMLPLDERTTQQMFTNFEKLGLHKMILRDPGNLTYYVARLRGDSEHRLIWGGNNQQPLDIVEQYYLTLYRLASRQDKMPVKQ